jgi:hypothetical protein
MIEFWCNAKNGFGGYEESNVAVREAQVFLASLGAEEAQVEAAFREAIATAQQQKSISLEKRAEATYAEYRKQKRTASGGRGFRLPLC